MSSSIPSSDVSPATPALLNAIGPMLEECYQRTAAALFEARAANQAELSQSITLAREANRQGRPADILEVLARLKGFEEEQIAPAIADYSEKVAVYVTPNVPNIPFVGKLITPNAFYDAFASLKTIAKYLLTPVIYAEDTDAIGLASINPIAAQILGEKIISAVHERTEIRPFITLARMNYESWTFLTRKHFEL